MVAQPKNSGSTDNNSVLVPRGFPVFFSLSPFWVVVKMFRLLPIRISARGTLVALCPFHFG